MKLLFIPKTQNSFTSDEKWKMLFFFFSYLHTSDFCLLIFLILIIAIVDAPPPSCFPPGNISSLLL